MTTSGARFPRQARVRARGEFDAVFKAARRTSDPLLSLHWLPGDGPARLGLAVSRKVDPHAVGRNRIKRALREQFRKLRTRLAHGDYVCVARAPAANADGHTLRATLVSVLQRAGALPPPDATCTMPGSLKNDALLSSSNPPHTSKPASNAG